MISIKVFVFNPFQENTYLLYDETKECVIVDPGCYSQQEQQVLSGFIAKENLTAVVNINTHTHIDHILGNNFIFKTYALSPAIHHAGLQFLQTAEEHGMMFGLKVEPTVPPNRFLEDGDVIEFGHSLLWVLYTPGHADGSVCLVSRENGFVITGDVLFSGSIGRTDLPTGNFNRLEESIRTKLYSLPNEYMVYPGHGPTTTIGAEKQGNPYVTS